jgi:hypothetical protein
MALLHWCDATTIKFFTCWRTFTRGARVITHSPHALPLAHIRRQARSCERVATLITTCHLLISLLLHFRGGACNRQPLAWCGTCKRRAVCSAHGPASPNFGGALNR